MVFCKEDNRQLLLSLKALVQRDRDAGEYVPPSFESILHSLDEMSGSSNNVREECGAFTRGRQVAYKPGREEFDVLKAYNSLIEAGGRPVCTLGETTYVSENPERYRTILGPWIKESSTDSALNWQDIFQQQLTSWLSFKAWQKNNRASSEVVLNSIEDTGCSRQMPRPLKLEIHIKPACQLLNRCGITKTFNLDINTDNQDEWTTWIEYLSFGGYCYDPYSRDLGCGKIKSLRKTMSLGKSAGREKGLHTIEPEARDGYPRDEQLFIENTRDVRQLQTLEGDAKLETRADNSVAEHSSLSTRVTKKDQHQFLTTLWPPAVDHHTLILRWVLIQDPKIAARSVNKCGMIPQDASPLFQGDSSRLKRYRDDSLCDSTKPPSCRQLELESLSDVQPSVAKKRRRK